jgi:dynein heavy chain
MEIPLFFKIAICEKFFLKNPSVTAFDERILYYSKMIEEVNLSEKIRNIDFIRVSMRSLIESLANHSKEWMKCLGKLLNDSAKQNLFDLKSLLEV